MNEAYVSLAIVIAAFLVFMIMSHWIISYAIHQALRDVITSRSARALLIVVATMSLWGYAGYYVYGAYL